MEEKKKGFTLIELLAVIVILAVVALIATPVVLSLIHNVRKSSSLLSANNYISALKNMILLKELDNQTLSGAYYINDLEAEYSGERIENGIVYIDDNAIKSAKLCINNYSIDYDGEKSKISTSDYCTNFNNKTIKIVNTNDETEDYYSINNNYEMTISLDDSINFIMCENGVISELENETIKLSEILADTTCYTSGNHENILNKVKEKELNITLLRDYTLNSGMSFPKNSNIVFNLENITLNTGGYYFGTLGNLTINSKEDSKVIGVGQALNNFGSGTVVINGGYYERNSGNGTAIYNEGPGTIIINHATIINSGNGTGIQNRLTSSTEKGLITINDSFVKAIGISIANNYGDIKINGGIYISDNTLSISNHYGNIDINASGTRMYVLSNSQVWRAAISNYKEYNININAKKANNCTNDYNDTTSGLCVYAEGNGDATSSSGNGAVQNVSSGNININGGTYFGLNTAVNNNSSGTINIQNAELISNQFGFFNNGTSISNISNSKVKSLNYAVININGNINLCSSQIYSSLNKDLSNGEGDINYSSNVLFSNLTNNPSIVQNNGNINSDYEGECI